MIIIIFCFKILFWKILGVLKNLRNSIVIYYHLNKIKFKWIQRFHKEFRHSGIYSSHFFWWQLWLLSLNGFLLKSKSRFLWRKTIFLETELCAEIMYTMPVLIETLEEISIRQIRYWAQVTNKFTLLIRL